MRNRKRLTSLILAAVMLCALLVPSISPAYAASPSEITQQIRNTYQASLQKAGRSSFNGYCGLYVNWQLVILGINSSYVGGNGNDEYDNYCNLSQSSGGYSIAAYPASQYSLQSALNAISANGTRDVTNILVGFEKGSGSDGALYGHTCFIHAIIDGNVYFSESFNATVGGTYYAEGSPIVCSISTFCSYYGSWTVLDGVIHFGGSTPPSPSDDSLSLYSYNYPTSLNVGETFSIYGTVSSGYSNITSLTVGVYNSSGSLETGKTVYPNSKTYSIANVDNYVLFNTLSAGTHYYRISATNASGTKQLLNKQFSVVGTSAVDVIRMVDCYRKVQLPARVINLYWNPTDTSRASYFDYGPYLSCPTYAEMSDGSIMYKATNVTHQGESVQLWFKYESDMTVTKVHTYGDVQYEYAHPHAAYKTCACGQVTYTGSNGSRDDCTDCRPAIIKGTCGDNLTWSLNTDAGNLIIMGTGAMTNWNYSSEVPWYPYRDSIISIHIYSDSSTIGDSAFSQCTKLTSISIPDDITSIGECAFWNCKGLTSIRIPDSVTSIGYYAFHGCTGLTSISIPPSVTDIKHSAFHGCSGLTSIFVDGRNPKYNSVNNCNAIIETATKTLIAGCKNTTIWYDVKRIGEDAFYGCTGLTSITIPNSVTRIDTCAFRGCSGLNSITIPAGVELIDNYAFADCTEMTHITFLGNAMRIGDYAFSACTRLTDVYFTGTEKEWNAITIGENNAPLTGANIHFQSKTCGDNLQWTLDTNTGVLRIIGTGKMTDYSSSETAPWYSVRKLIQTVIIDGGVTNIGNYAFYYCENLNNITIPDSVTRIGVRAFFHCSCLTSIMIPDKVTDIDQQAFSFCSGLTSITIPASVTNFGYVRTSPFSGCTSLTSIRVAAGNSYYDSRNNCNAIIETKQNRLICGCQTTVIPNSVTSIDSFAFSECTGLTTISIPDGVTSIDYCAFKRCTGLTSVTISNSVTSIYKNAFFDCTGLKDVYFIGTEEEWSAINIGNDNDCLTGANIHFMDQHTHSYAAVVTAPSCTEQGFTTYSCNCGDSYVTNYVGALGHNFVNSVCTRCGANDLNFKPTEPTKFVDVPQGEWFTKAVEYSVGHGLMNGVGNGMFAPNDSMTRSMLVTVLWRYEGSPEGGTNTFADVPAGKWFTKAVAWASANGIVGGVGNNRFDPDGEITREQMATILFRYAEKKEIDTSKRGSLGGFSDAERVSAYAKDALQWAVAEKIIGGSDGKLLPQGSATRAQVATILMRFIENIV